MGSLWFELYRMPYEDRVKKVKHYAEYVRYLCKKNGLPDNCLGYDLDNPDEVADMLYDYCLELSGPECEQRLRDAVDEVFVLANRLKQLKREGEYTEELISFAYSWLEDRNMPNADKLARLLANYVYRGGGHGSGRIKQIPMGIRMYIIVGQPTKWAREVQGEVEIGEVGGRKVFLIVPSLDDIEQIRGVRYNRARIVVRRGWVEEY